MSPCRQNPAVSSSTEESTALTRLAVNVRSDNRIPHDIVTDVRPGVVRHHVALPRRAGAFRPLPVTCHVNRPNARYAYLMTVSLFAVHGYARAVTVFSRKTYTFSSADNEHISTPPGRMNSFEYPPDSTPRFSFKSDQNRFGKIGRVRRVVSATVRRTPVETSHYAKTRDQYPFCRTRYCYEPSARIVVKIEIVRDSTSNAYDVLYL